MQFVLRTQLCSLYHLWLCLCLCLRLRLCLHESRGTFLLHKHTNSTNYKLNWSSPSSSSESSIMVSTSGGINFCLTASTENDTVACQGGTLPPRSLVVPWSAGVNCWPVATAATCCAIFTALTPLTMSLAARISNHCYYTVRVFGREKRVLLWRVILWRVMPVGDSFRQSSWGSSSSLGFISSASATASSLAMATFLSSP